MFPAPMDHSPNERPLKHSHEAGTCVLVTPIMWISLTEEIYRAAFYTKRMALASVYVMYCKVLMLYNNVPVHLQMWQRKISSQNNNSINSKERIFYIKIGQ